MNISEAKQVLSLYRPGGTDTNDPQIAEALALARQDSSLGSWLVEHNRFQTAMRNKFRGIDVPSNLKEIILTQPKVITPPWWRDIGWLRAAASIILVIGLCYGLSQLVNRSRIPDSFADYRLRMVRSALREYRMDLLTTDLKEVRNWMSSHGAPADFAVPPGLARLELTGGGVLRWRNNPVTMVCYNRGDDQMLFLFIMNRTAVNDPPATAPKVARINQLLTASWSEGNKTYVLAGQEETDFLQKYF